MKRPVVRVTGAHSPGRGGLRLAATVKESEALGSMVRLTVDAPGWPGALPGQFALLHPLSSRRFLGRALSISDERGTELDFLIAPAGEGTRELCGLSSGSVIRLLGPLGNGFDLDLVSSAESRTVLVGGGVGIAPFPLLLSRLAALQTGAVLALLGFRDAEQAKGAEAVRRVAAGPRGDGIAPALEIITEDGSTGAAGKVTDLLKERLLPGDRLAVCGPQAMAREVWRICSAVNGVGAWFSMEADMACGVGSCHGCVTLLADGSYVRVCHEGPVFSGEEFYGG